MREQVAVRALHPRTTVVLVLGGFGVWRVFGGWRWAV